MNRIGQLLYPANLPKTNIRIPFCDAGMIDPSLLYLPDGRIGNNRQEIIYRLNSSGMTLLRLPPDLTKQDYADFITQLLGPIFRYNNAELGVDSISNNPLHVPKNLAVSALSRNKKLGLHTDDSQKRRIKVISLFYLQTPTIGGILIIPRICSILQEAHRFYPESFEQLFDRDALAYPDFEGNSQSTALLFKENSGAITLRLPSASPFAEIPLASINPKEEAAKAFNLIRSRLMNPRYSAVIKPFPGLLVILKASIPHERTAHDRHHTHSLWRTWHAESPEDINVSIF